MIQNQKMQPTRAEHMEHLKKEFNKSLITITEFSFLEEYRTKISVLLAPPNSGWVGPTNEWNQLHCAYGIAGELLELENETNLIPLIKEFGDCLFYLVNLIDTIPSCWTTVKHMIHDDLVYDEKFYCHISFKSCLIRHVDEIADMVKRKIFYGNMTVDPVVLTRHIVSALVFLKMGYASCVNSYDEIYSRLVASSINADEAAHWKDVICMNDDTVFSEQRDLIAIGKRNLNKLLLGKNARYASGTFNVQDSIAKKDAVEDGKPLPTSETTL